METLGPKGLRELAYHNLQKAHYALENLVALDGLKRRFEGQFFNEFVLELKPSLEKISTALKKKGIIAGYPLERNFPELKNCLLICVTEVHSREKIETLVNSFKEVMS